MTAAGKHLILLPTYNEAENLPAMLAALLAGTEADILCIDDASPDGTGAIADSWAARDPRIKVLHRPAKEGLGRAYVAGFRAGLPLGYEGFLTMDCDFSHDPAVARTLLDLGRVAPLVIGSRYAPGGATPDWPWWRRALSALANTAARALLGAEITDWTSGFKYIRAGLLRLVDLGAMETSGYGYQVEIAWRLLRAGAVPVEAPIVFRERRAGKSKFSPAIVVEAAGLLWNLFLTDLLYSRPAPAVAAGAAPPRGGGR
ncbi:MAG: polyprenol monophosphomannose synthase [Planctomycetes bacterium]|nr:polyprenol monophosphomannose synthase [Planctomycetota bacterium]